MIKQRLVVFSGAGMSAESGIKTFRDGNGLWENHRIEEVATPNAWKMHPGLVLKFYNERRTQIRKSNPNSAHLRIAQLENLFDVKIVSQNIDDLHERAGNTSVLHLHGEINKAKCDSCTRSPFIMVKKTISIDDRCVCGGKIRPHVVWFGEEVPTIQEAINVIKEANIFLIIGTSLQVYPAASLVHFVPLESKVYLIDPGQPHVPRGVDWTIISSNAIEGMERVFKELAKKK